MYQIRHFGRLVELPDAKANEFESVELADQTIRDLHGHVFANLDEIAARMRITADALCESNMKGWEVVGHGHPTTR